MENKNKYYTPTIEELKVGLECEWLADPANEIYKSIELTATMLSLTLNTTGFNFERLGVPGPMTNYRIKYLDAEDIESLGFKHEQENLYTFNHVNGQTYTLSVYAGYGNKIEIRCSHPSINYGNFLGYCKNKSELKTIMKQVGIL